MKRFKKKQTKRIPILSMALLIAIGSILYFPSCKKDEPPYIPPVDSISPDDPNAIQTVLTIPNGTLVGGTPPAASSNSDAPSITSHQTSVEFNPGMTFYLPFAFDANAAWEYLYVYVTGATNGHIRVSNTSSSATSGAIIIPITLPGHVQFGSFTIEYSIGDANGLISNWVTTLIVLSAPMECEGAYAYGYEGLTATMIYLGDNPGTVELDYDTYYVPDRIDIYQGTTWITGTGNDLGLPAPPLVDCNDAFGGYDGFVGEAGTLSFNYNPSNGKYIIIYVSGCIGQGTAWEWQLRCPN